MLALLFGIQLLLAVPIILCGLLQIEILPRVFVGLRVVLGTVVIQADGRVHFFIFLLFLFFNFHHDGGHVVLLLILLCIYRVLRNLHVLVLVSFMVLRRVRNSMSIGPNRELLGKIRLILMQAILFHLMKF